jgi:enoyl-CoA hydratase/carnithine racemase
MSEFVRTHVSNGTGFITLDRPKALNSLSLDMVRAMTATLRAWAEAPEVKAVLLRSTSDKALCAGGDIRFFHEVGRSTPQGDSALLEDFFTEEYALNHLIHFYPKCYVALMDGVVMGGGMGIAQGGPACGARIVTGRSKLAMPEVNIGLFPDVGGSHFLSHAPGQLGMWLGLTGLTVGAADALYLNLADYFVPEQEMAGLMELIDSTPGTGLRAAIGHFTGRFRAFAGDSELEAQRALIDRHFAADTVAGIMASLRGDSTPFAQKSLKAMELRSPLMMCVTHELLRRGASMSVADCLRMERNLVRRNFEHGEVLEGIRALVIDKDNQPRWNPPTVDAVDPAQVQHFFAPCWPDYAHPLRHLV